MNWLWLMSFVIAGWGTAGCATVKGPHIQVIDAEIVEMTDEAASLSFLLELQNNNDQPLPLREFKYNLIANGKSVFQSRRSAEATIPQNSSYALLLPAVLTYEKFGGVPNGVITCVLSGELTYVDPGTLSEVLLDMEIRVPSVNFSGSQDVDFTPKPTNP